MIPQRWRAKGSLKLMPKRGSDADTRIFFDQLVSVGVSRLRATGAIRLEDRQVVIPFGEQNKLIGVAHTNFWNGGSWSYFRCPKCGRRAKKLWLVDDAPRCRLCLEKLGVRYRSAYAFGRSERLKERDHRVDKLQAMLEGGPLRLKPVPPNWGNRRLDRRRRLTWSLQRARIVARLAQLAYQEQSSKPDASLPFLSAYKPHSAAIEAVPDLKSLWRSKTTEELECALDKAQSTILRSIANRRSSNAIETPQPSCSGHAKQENAARLKAAIERKDPASRVFFAPSNLRAGGSWTAQLAEEIAEANAFILLVGEAGVGKWQVPEYDEALDRWVKSERTFPLVVVLLEGQTAPGLPFLRQLHWIVTPDPASEKDIARIFDAASGRGARPPELWRYASPYRGLEAMEEKDSDYFFGRTRETVETLEALAKRTAGCRS